MPDNLARLKIEEFLVGEGFVSSQEMVDARSIRRKHIEQSKKQLGLILLGQKMISQEQLMHLLSLPAVQRQIGKRAVEKSMISSDQLEECQKQVKQQAQPISQMLFRKGYISDEDRKQLVYEQLDTIFFAKQAIDQDMIREGDLESVIKLKDYKKSTCEILYEQNRVTLSELNHAFRKFSQDLKLGQILLQQGMISRETVEKALSIQADANKSFGQILLENKWVAIDQLYFALSIQYNTPFQKLDGYIYYEKQKAELRNIIGQGYACEHQILPLFFNGDKLTLGVSNPARIWSMGDLKSRHPGFQMACVLITNEKFEQLYALLYGEILPAAFNQSETWQRNTQEANMVINDPQTQIDRIKLLYRTYQNQVQISKEGGPVPEEENWFVEFIEENFNTICSTYGCSSVRFRCNVTEGKTQLSASPLT